MRAIIMSGFTVTLCSLISLVPLVSYGNGKASSGQNSLGALCTSCSDLAGIPGIPGKPGDQGPAGRDGRDGRNGRNGAKGAKGSPGPRGLRGPAGSQGRTGPQGPPGASGKAGAQGNTGPRGPPGPKGEPGPIGPTGREDNHAINWKHCVWKAKDERDNGKIKDCTFTKLNSDTALHVYYEGNLRVLGCTVCCKRWYFTFNGAECRGPMTIEGAYYFENVTSDNPHRHRHIEGHCENIHKGKVHVGFWVGNCAGYSGHYDAATGWNSVSRIFIEEVPKPQE